MYAYAKSLKGKDISVNGDFFVTDTVGDYTVLIIADGFGGDETLMNIGAIPSGIVMDYLERAILNKPDITPEQLKGQMIDGLYAASRAMRTLNGIDPRYRGACASIACLAISNLSNKMAHASVGNCEIQLWRNGQFVRLNQLHTAAFEKLEKGKIKEADYYTQPDRNLITSGIGLMDEIKISAHAGSLREGDVIIMSSDGVYQYMTPGDVMESLAQSQTPTEGVDKMLEKINDFDNTDNSTLLCLFVD